MQFEANFKQVASLSVFTVFKLLSRSMIPIKVMVSVSGIPQITSGKFQMKNKMEVIDTNNQYLVKLNHGINY